MRGKLSFVMAVVLGLAFAAGDAYGQNPQVREGFWFSGGLGFGSLGCNDCDSREGGLSGGLSLGTTLNQRVLLGVGTHAWTKSEDGVRLNVGTLTALARFYPSYDGGFYLLGGVGLGSMEVRISGFGNASETGVGAVLGMGYDFRIGRMISLSPYWNGVGMSFSDGDANFGQVGVGVTFH